MTRCLYKLSSGYIRSPLTIIFPENMQDFDAMFAVRQENDKGGTPFKVQLAEGAVSGGIGGVVFSNVGGVLTLENVMIDSSSFTSVASTGTSSQGDEGSTFLRGVTVSDSIIKVSRLCYRA